MNIVQLSPWANDIDKNVPLINQVTNQIQGVIKRFASSDVSGEQMRTLIDNMCEVMNFWVGSTYVGCPKDKKLVKAYNAFFSAVLNWLLCLRKLPVKECNEFAEEALYQGILHRYLGHGSAEDDIESKVEPIYNNSYVSWSKVPQVDYLEQKLYGTRTHITCEVQGIYYGIDLEAFGVSRPNEAEVVFPTIEETITDVKYDEWKRGEDDE